MFATAVDARQIFGIIALGLGLSMVVSSAVSSNHSQPSQIYHATPSYGSLPLQFEPNLGQADAQIKFLARGQNYNLLLSATRAVMILKQEQNRSAIVGFELIGANSGAIIQGKGKSSSVINILHGDHASHVQPYTQVEVKAIYPNIDLVYYGNPQHLEYDFRLAAHTNPHKIRMHWTGIQAVSVDQQGNLHLQTSAGEIQQPRPLAYQMIAGQRQDITVSYQVDHDHKIGFIVGDYDPTKPLVIDPVLSYSTYLGGSNTDAGYGIAVDTQGQTYITGTTLSPDFPVTGRGSDLTFNGNTDIFVAKLNAQGTALIYATYLGGSEDDTPGILGSIAVDQAGNTYLTGDTQSNDFPTTLGALDRTISQGDTDAFVVKLNSIGGLVYGTYLGGSQLEESGGLTVDKAGQVYATGDTYSTDFPVTAGALRTQGTGSFRTDIYVTKLNATGTALIYSTFLGGSNYNYFSSIAIDQQGSAYVTGKTFSPDFPTTPGAFAPATSNNVYFGDGFVSKLNPTGSHLIYSTYLAGSGQDSPTGIAVDKSGNAYITGNTVSPDFPVTAGAFDTSYGTFGSFGDAFITKLNSVGSALVYSSYLGGNGSDDGRAIALDRFGNAYLTGYTDGSFPITTNALDPSYNGAFDAFVTVFNNVGSKLLYSSYLGSTSTDTGYGIAVDPKGNIYVTGNTTAADFPVTGTSSYQGKSDAFVTKIQLLPKP